ncbi:MAG: hypothetical protein ACI9R3_001015 [Verrucomicrobiales bacterium]|jgi:hypothetical protein
MLTRVKIHFNQYFACSAIMVLVAIETRQPARLFQETSVVSPDGITV